MSPRLKLRAAATPLVMAGALWATSGLAPVALGGGAQTPPPCGPDGVCVPRPETFGVYQTRWRAFPGDSIGKTPTAATAEPEKPELGGPKLPTPAEEGQLGPAKAPRAPGAAGEEPAAEGGEDAAAAGLGTLPGEVPLPGIELPGVGQPAPDAAGDEQPGALPEPGAPPEPGAEPGANPLDPFGSAPPAPPAWLKSAALQNRGLGAELPMVDQTAAIDASRMDGPNLHGDDAPPALPPALRGAVGAAPNVAPKVVQPASVAAPIVDDRVTKASAVQPVGIQLINPAAAMVDPEAEGLQQAIYFEVSDQ